MVLIGTHACAVFLPTLELPALSPLGAHVVLVEPFHANAAAARLNTLRTGRVFVEQAAIWGGRGSSGGGGGGVDGIQQQGIGLARLSRTNVWGGNAAEVRDRNGCSTVSVDACNMY